MKTDTTTDDIQLRLAATVELLHDQTGARNVMVLVETDGGRVYSVYGGCTCATCLLHMVLSAGSISRDQHRIDAAGGDEQGDRHVRH